MLETCESADELVFGWTVVPEMLFESSLRCSRMLLSGRRRVVQNQKRYFCCQQSAHYVCPHFDVDSLLGTSLSDWVGFLCCPLRRVSRGFRAGANDGHEGHGNLLRAHATI